MAFATDSRRIAGAVVTVAASSLAMWFGNGLDPWWPLIWFAPLPVLLHATRSSWTASAAVAFFSLLLGSLNMFQYFRLLGSPAYLWCIVYIAASLAWTFAVLHFRLLLLRGAHWSALLAFPATWVTCEYARNLLTPHGTAGSFAYTQLNFLSFLQLASITGPWGMSFLILLLPACVAIAWHLRGSSPRQALRIFSAGLAVMVLVLVYGAIRLAQPQPGEKITVGLVASDVPGNLLAAAGAPTQRLLRDYAAQAVQLAAKGAQVIVLPEKLATIADPDTGPGDAILQSVADDTAATIAAGVVHIAGPVQYNEARIYQPRQPVLTYQKHHMLPPFENIFQPGRTITAIDKPTAVWGVAICKDMDFTQLSRQYGNAGTGLLFDPGWDFNIDRAWHGHIAILRGVESGFSIAHSAKNGYLTVTDDRGRILAETRSDSSAFATLLATVPQGHDSTLFLRFGDWFAWLSIALFAITLARRFTVRNRTLHASQLPSRSASAAAHVSL